MKINNLNLTNTFKGYKNLYAHSIDLHDNDAFTFIGMELNNEKTNDLEVWENLQRRLGIPAEKISNVVIFHNFRWHNQDFFSLSSKKFDLSKLDKPYDEETKVKAFTFMADLTRKIINAPYHPRTNKEHLTLVEVINNLKTFLKDEATVQILTMEAALRRQDPKKIAEIMNNRIDKNMKAYFKKL